jgi:ABC-type nickel/cobalt efflux system permease component RcnA
MLRKYASLVIAIALVAVVTTACIVRTGPPRRSQGAHPAHVEKHKKHKHKKHKHKKHKRR